MDVDWLGIIFYLYKCKSSTFVTTQSFGDLFMDVITEIEDINFVEDFVFFKEILCGNTIQKYYTHTI